MKISLVIPAYNERLIIGDTVRAALDYLAARYDSFELIVVDDGSADGTAEIVKGFADGRVLSLGYEVNRGKGRAVRTGMLAARGDLIFYTDADLAYGLEVIGQAVERFDATGADMVIGSRRLDKKGYGEYSGLRRAASKCFSLAARLASGMRYDTQCGFKGFRKVASDAIFARCRTDGFAFDFEVMMLAAGAFRVQQLPVRIVNHRESKVKLIRDSVRMLREIVRIRARMKRDMK